MKTDDLVSMLATGALPVPRQAATRRLRQAVVLGLPISAAIMLLQFGVRPDLREALSWPMFWVKLLFPAAVAVAGFVAVQRLARPGVPLGKAGLAMVLPVLLVWALALLAWSGAPADTRAELLWGSTWRACVFSIALMALPVFAAAMVALRSLAPTRPAWAGAAAGALAGGAGAAVYALHCPELAAPFLAVWYVAGMGLPVLLGAVLGPRLLRW